MIRVFLSHKPEALEIFYRERAIKDLKEFAEARINDIGRVLTTDTLEDRARGCDIVISSATGLRARPVTKWMGRLKRSAHFLRKGRA
jgi:hypothetical protein